MMNKKLVALGYGAILLSGIAMAMAWLLVSSLAVQADPGARFVAITGQDTTNNCSLPSTPCRTVQHAVDVATPGDIIRVATGVYTDVHNRHRPPNYDAPVSFTTVKQIVLITKTVTIRGGYTTDFSGPPRPEIYPTTLDAGGEGRVLLIAGVFTPTIEGFRITGGDATGLYGEGGPVDAGGGIYSTDATAIISGNVIFENNAYYGGGLHLRFGHTTLINNSILTNTASFGGGVRTYYNNGGFTGNKIKNNTAVNGGGVALTNCDDITFNENTVESNTASTAAAGGLYISVCPAVVEENTVISNTAMTNGGGLYLYAADDVTLQDNTFSANTAAEGGGINMYLSAANLFDNQITNNSADAGSGLLFWLSDATLSRNTILANSSNINGSCVLFLRQSSPTLVNNVIADNQTSSTTGCGIYIAYGSNPHLIHTTIARNGGAQGIGIRVTSGGGPNSTVTLTNTILVGEYRGVYANSGSSANLLATLWQNTDDCNGSGTIITGSINYWGDPLFTPDGYHLLLGSAAIDRGVATGVTDDIDEQARPQGVAPDIGADEYLSTINYWIFLPVTVKNY